MCQAARNSAPQPGALLWQRRFQVSVCSDFLDSGLYLLVQAPDYRGALKSIELLEGLRECGGFDFDRVQVKG